MMDTSGSHNDTSASIRHTEQPAVSTVPTAPVTIVREDTKIPQPPVDAMEVDEEAIDEVIRKAEGKEPSPDDKIEEWALAPSRSRPKAPVGPRWVQSSFEDTNEDIRGAYPECMYPGSPSEPQLFNLSNPGAIFSRTNTNLCDFRCWLGRCFRGSKGSPNNR